MTYLPLLMQNMFNTPIALSSRKAEMIVAALAGKLDIKSLMSETVAFDQAAMRDLSARGRDEARLERELQAAKKNNAPMGPWASSDMWWGDCPYFLSKSGIAVIEICGTLTRTWGLNPESGSTGYDGIWTKLSHAVDNPDCKGIWLKIASGGGAVDGLMDLAMAIYKCSARNGGKPIWSFAGDYAYSAAYTLGSAGDQFFAPYLGGVGSCACLAIFIDQTVAMEMEGLEAHIFRSGKRKAIGVGGIESLDQAEIDHIQNQIDVAGDYLCENTAMFRGIAKSRVSQTQGNDYTATDAKAIGFIDGIMSEQDAWAKFERSLA